MADAPPPGEGAVAALYLGNLLYALERCALALDDDGKPEEGAFYRGIGRLLAEAHARERPSADPAPPAPG